jgi:hypothetical protein
VGRCRGIKTAAVEYPSFPFALPPTFQQQTATCARCQKREKIMGEIRMGSDADQRSRSSAQRRNVEKFPTPLYVILRYVTFRYVTLLHELS